VRERERDCDEWCVCEREGEFAVAGMFLAVDGVQVTVDTNDGVHMCVREREIAVGGV